MAESMVSSSNVVTSEEEDDDFFIKFKLRPVKVIDMGMCGEIVLARPIDTIAAKRVVKTFTLLDEATQSMHTEMFQAEVEFMKSFDHPFLMKLLIAGECREYQAICMTYYHSGTLFDYVECVSFNHAERCFTQVACALRYMHKKNVVHLDVKLDNIFMDNDLNAVLGDFGLAQKLSPEYQKVSLLNCGGTACYFAPELIGVIGDKELDPYKMDSYCLGVVLWSLVMKRYPDDNINYDLEARNRLDLPIIIRHLLTKLLEKDPSRRQTVTDLLTRVRRLSSYRHVIDNY